jgi:amino-acid N-acetyltransferase
MPRLYIEEYTRALMGKTVCTACRGGVLKDHVESVIADIKFLNRQKVDTVFYHNLPNRPSHQKTFALMSRRLPETRIVRVPPEIDFYARVLDREQDVHKLIFLEHKSMLDQNGRKINAVTTRALRQRITTWGDLIANVNFKDVLERICTQIDGGHYDRVHILPAGKNAIKHELFTIEGHGTLIANNFVEHFQPMAAKEDMRLTNGILQLYQHEGYLKPRTKAYLKQHHHNFFVTLIDDIVVGCVEKKHIDPQTAEIAALAISTRFRNQRVGLFTVKAFMHAMQQEGYVRFISLTNNPNLRKLYQALGFSPCQHTEYQARQALSPDVAMFCKVL